MVVENFKMQEIEGGEIAKSRRKKCEKSIFNGKFWVKIDQLIGEFSFFNKFMNFLEENQWKT